ncbi:MAG: sulfite oxidase [Actinomycetes bacterium]
MTTHQADTRPDPLQDLGAARVAEPGEAVSLEEVQLAARNHGMPLEMLRYDVTPLGTHYLLTHYDIPYVDPATWQLRIGGRVANPFSLDLDDLRARPRVTARVTLECAGNGRARLDPRPVSQPWLQEAVGTSDWTGTPLAPLLREAGLDEDAHDVVFTGADHGLERGVEQDYARGLPVAEALRDDVLLAYEINGAALPPQHGAPLRLVVPGWYGMTHVKWLSAIDVIDHAFDGYQNMTSYRYKQDADELGEPVTRIYPRALMVPPGFPDFMTRTRVVDVGTHVLEGRAWSGWAPVTSVEVSVDDGRTWAPATLDPEGEPYAWRHWSYRWDATEPGSRTLLARASDGAGHVQSVDLPWNRQGVSNNGAQQVHVVVRAPD